MPALLQRLLNHRPKPLAKTAELRGRGLNTDSFTLNPIPTVRGGALSVRSKPNGLDSTRPMATSSSSAAPSGRPYSTASDAEYSGCYLRWSCSEETRKLRAISRY